MHELGGKAVCAAFLLGGRLGYTKSLLRVLEAAGQQDAAADVRLALHLQWQLGHHRLWGGCHGTGAPRLLESAVRRL